MGPPNDTTLYGEGLQSNGVSTGAVTWVVPLNAPDVLYYVCSRNPSISNRILVSDNATFFQIWFEGNYIPPNGMISFELPFPLKPLSLNLVNSGDSSLTIFRSVFHSETPFVAFNSSDFSDSFDLPPRRLTTFDVNYDGSFRGSFKFETNDIQIWYLIDVDVFLSQNNSRENLSQNPWLFYLPTFILGVGVFTLVVVAVMVTRHVMQKIYFTEKEEEEKMLGDEYTYDVDGNEVVLEELVKFDEDERENLTISEGNGNME